MARSYQLSAFGTQVPYRELYKIIVSATYTLVPEDNNKILIFALGANATVNLPAAAAVEGMNFKIWNSNSGTFTVTIDPQGAEQIDGAATLVLEVGEGARCYAFAGGLPTSTGARWITDRVNAADVFSTAVIAGSTKNSVLRYTGTTATAGALDGGAVAPTGTTRLNYSGNFHANNFVGTTLNSIIFNNATVTTTSTTQTALMTVPLASHITGKVFIRATRGTERQATELLITHNGTTAISTEYGTISTSGNTLFTTDVDINSTNLRVLVTATSATSTVFVAVYTFI